MGCSYCKVIEYHGIKSISPHKTIRLEENALITSMLQLEEGRILCGDNTGNLIVYEIDNQRNYSSITRDDKHKHQIFSLCKLNNGAIVSASFDKLLIWEFFENKLNFKEEYEIDDGDIDKVIGLNGDNNKFAVGYRCRSQSTIIISIYEYNSKSPSKEAIKILPEEQENSETMLRSMFHLKFNNLLVSSCKSSSEGHLSFWDTDAETIKHKIPKLCTDALNGMIEFPPNLFVVASSNSTFAIFKLDTYEIVKIIEDTTRDMFYPGLISFTIFKDESLLYASNRKFGQILIRGKNSDLKYFFEHTEKFRGNGLIINLNERYIIVDNDANEDNKGALSVLEFDFLKIQEKVQEQKKEEEKEKK